jgi:hypothetical protein
MAEINLRVFTIYDMDENRGWLGVRRRARILAGVVDVHVSNQQIIGESFSVLGELRQSRLRLEAQNLQVINRES